MSPPGRRALLPNLALAVGSILLTLLVLETGLRVCGHLENRGTLDRDTQLAIEPPDDGPADLGHMIRLSDNRRVIYELKPGLDVLYSGARVRTDGDGFRSASSAAELREAGFRVVGLGDSFMFGQGVEAEETYLSLLETRLRRRHPNLDARVLNMAVPGYNTVMEIAAFEEEALAWCPDLVIIEYVSNDLHLPNFIRTRNDVLAIDRLYLVDFVERRLRRGREPELFERLARLGLEPGLAIDEKRVPAEYRDMVGFSSYVDAMRRLRALSLEHGFSVFTITLSPSPGRRHVLTVSSDLGFHVLDVGEVFTRYLEARGHPEYLGSPLALSPDDGHPSAAGHRVASGAILRYMDEYGLLPPVPRAPAHERFPGRRSLPGNPS